MNKLRTMTALLSAAFFVPILAQADNLWTSPESFQVAPTNQPSAYGLEFAKASKKKTVEETSDTDQSSVSLFDNSDAFVQLYSGFDFSFLSDIVDNTNALKSYAQGLGDTTSGGGSNIGILAGALVGLHLDKSNSLALDLGSILTFGSDLNIESGAFYDRTDPIALSASLDYILDIVKNKGARTYLTVGAGWYHAVVGSSVFTGTGPFTGTFTGDTIGGTLGVGEEVDLGGSFGLDLSVKGRYAYFDRVTSGNAIAAGGNGASTLAVANGGGIDFVVPVNNADLTGPGVRPAHVDYSGFDAKVALNLYL